MYTIRNKELEDIMIIVSPPNTVKKSKMTEKVGEKKPTVASFYTHRWTDNDQTICNF